MIDYSEEVILEMIEFMKKSPGMCNSPAISSLEAELERRKSLDLIEVSGCARKTYHGRKWGYLTAYVLINGVKVEPTAQTPQLSETKGKDTILMPRSDAIERGLLCLK